MCNSGRFTVVVPDVYTQDLEIAERHLIVDTKKIQQPIMNNNF